MLDIDPRNGGAESLRLLAAELGENAPEIYWRVATPSGGKHFYIASLDIGKHIGFMPGLDLLGRGAFAFLPPTVRKGGTYTPGPSRLAALNGDGPCEALAARVSAATAVARTRDASGGDWGRPPGRARAGGAASARGSQARCAPALGATAPV